MTPRSTAAAYGSASSARPFSSPYDGCENAYIHEYKLNLHLRRDHTVHFPDDNAKNTQSNIDNEMDEASVHRAYAGKRGQPKPNLKLPPSKVAHEGSIATPANLNVVKNHGRLKCTRKKIVKKQKRIATMLRMD